MIRLATCITLLAVTTLSTAAVIDQDFLGAGVTPFTGEVDAPDVVGGWVSGEIIMTMQPGVSLTFDAKGICRVTGAGAPGLSFESVMESLGATASRPLYTFPLANTTSAETMAMMRTIIVTVPTTMDIPEHAQLLQVFDRVIETAEPNTICGILAHPNDTHYDKQYPLHNTGQSINGAPGVNDADMDLPEAWDITTGDSGTIVAIVDTGVSNSHPDLQCKLLQGYNFVDGNTNTDDSWLISHGSHCASLAAACSDNGTGVSGVNHEAMILPVKVLNLLGSGTLADVANGITWAADNGAHVISLSLGAASGETALQNACNYAWNSGAVVMAATGNDGGPVSYPAAYSSVLAVGATDNRDVVASFSNRGNQVFCTAAGVDVYGCIDTLFTPDTYDFMSGTSMACPNAAGVASLVHSANPDLTNQEIADILAETADDKGSSGWDTTYGHGRLNAYAAVLAADPDDSAPGDVTGDGIVDVADILELLSQWGPCSGCSGDLNGDGIVGVPDLLIVLDNWG